MRAARAVVAVTGLLLIGYGGFLLVSRQDPDRWLAALVWLAGGVVLHDAVLAPVTLLAGVAAARWLPARGRRAAVVAVVLLGPLTLLAIPVLGRFGARPDNPTLLDRPYLASWLVLVAVAIAGVVVASLVRSRET